MGLGDDVMATGRAWRIHAEKGGTVTIGRSRQKPSSSPIYRHLPFLRQDGSGDHLLVDHIGNRPYIDYGASRKQGRQVLFADHRPPRGRLRFHMDELREAWRLLPGVQRHIVLEPHVKGTFSGPNKRWPWEHWVELAAELRKLGHELAQVSDPVHAQTLPGVTRVETDDVRLALAVLMRSRLLITTDGLLHHSAAAMKVPAVVLWGERTNPEILGYPEHVNLTTGSNWCGSVKTCDHCLEAMQSLTVSSVLEKVKECL